MILNMLISTGGTDTEVTKKSIIFYGAPNETLTLYGVTVYTIPLDANGTATAEIPIGDYLIMGSISKGAMSAGRNVSITSETTSVTVYPESAIYWYGDGDQSGESLFSICGGFSEEFQYYYPSDVGSRGYLTDNTLTYNKTNLSVTMNKDAPGGDIYYIAGASLFMKKPINHTGYTKLKIKASGNGSFYTTTVTPSNAATKFSYVDKGKVTGNVITLTPSTYLVYYYGGQAAQIRGKLTIEAIWLE